LYKQTQFAGRPNDWKPVSNKELQNAAPSPSPANQTQQTQFAGLSFLRKQESRLFDGPGFRIKCGMTALKVRLTEYGLYKQTQFAFLLFTLYLCFLIFAL